MNGFFRTLPNHKGLDKLSDQYGYDLRKNGTPRYFELLRTSEPDRMEELLHRHQQWFLVDEPVRWTWRDIMNTQTEAGMAKILRGCLLRCLLEPIRPPESQDVFGDPVEQVSLREAFDMTLVPPALVLKLVNLARRLLNMGRLERMPNRNEYYRALLRSGYLARPYPNPVSAHEKLNVEDNRRRLVERTIRANDNTPPRKAPLIHNHYKVALGPRLESRRPKAITDEDWERTLTEYLAGDWRLESGPASVIDAKRDLIADTEPPYGTGATVDAYTLAILPLLANVHPLALYRGIRTEEERRGVELVRPRSWGLLHAMLVEGAPLQTLIDGQERVRSELREVAKGLEPFMALG